MKNLPILAILLLGLTLSCNDEERPASSSYEEPHRFFAYATLNGINHQVKAGEKDYALFTSQELKNQVITLSTFLAQDTAHLHNAWAIHLRGEGQELGKALQETDLPWSSNSGFTQIPNEVSYSFWCEPRVRNYQANWVVSGCSPVNVDTFATGVINTKEQPSLDVSLTPSHGAAVPQVSYNLATTWDDKLNMYLSFDNSNNRLYGQLAVERGHLEQVNYFPPTASFDSLGQTFVDLGRSNYPINLVASVQFKSGQNQTLTKTLQSANFDHDVNLYFNRQPHWESNPLNQNTVELVYYNENGIAFRPLPGQGHFSLNRIVPYTKKGFGNGEHKQVFFTGSGLLKSENGDTLYLEQLNGSFAFELP